MPSPSNPIPSNPTWLYRSHSPSLCNVHLDTFISKIEHGLHCRQAIAHKLMRHLNSNIKDTVNITVIGTEQWKDHYKNLQYNPNIIDNSNTDLDLSYTIVIDPTELFEVEMALKWSKNRKAPSPDGINLKLLKYGGLTVITRLHIFLDTCWITCSILHTLRSAQKFRYSGKEMRTIVSLIADTEYMPK